MVDTAGLSVDAAAGTVALAPVSVTRLSPTVGAIIRRSAALLKVKPQFGEDGKPLLVSY